jgi:fibronectin type 3 domain-containing protein
LKEENVMAFRKHSLLAFALLALSAIALGCAEDTTAPNTQNEAPVLAPTNVQATALGGGDIRITWNPSSQPDVAGYNVYRLDTEAGALGRLNDKRIETTNYTDGGAERGHRYEYRVTAVTSKGSESRFAAVLIETPRRTSGKPGVPGTNE